MIRGVIFDLDHTLFDRYETIRKSFHIFYSNYRERIPENMTCDVFIEELIAIEKKYVHFGWKRVFEVCGERGLIKPFSEEEIPEAVKFVINDCWNVCTAEFPFTNPMLKELRSQGYKLGIITNGNHQCQDLKMQRLGLYELVDEVMISGDFGVHKPNTKLFDIMSEKIGIPANRLLYVGDNPINDIEASRKAGYIPVWVKTTGYWCSDDIERAEYEIETVEELPELIKKIKA